MKPLLLKPTFILFFTAFTLFSACSSNHLKESEDPEVVYNEAVRLIEKNRFIEASEYLNEVRRRFPQSRFAVLAELRGADSYYTQELYTEAAASYGTFVELYPSHPEAPYAQYRRALSYYNDSPSEIARDQSAAKNAASAASLLVRRYPQSPFVKESEELYLKSRIKLAEKEAYIARWYEKKKEWLAAFRRWKGLEFAFADLKNHESTTSLFEEAKTRSDKLAERYLTRDQQSLPESES
jgi:outer membrane protein assembly factor BamD